MMIFLLPITFKRIQKRYSKSERWAKESQRAGAAEYV